MGSFRMCHFEEFVEQAWIQLRQMETSYSRGINLIDINIMKREIKGMSGNLQKKNHRFAEVTSILASHCYNIELPEKKTRA